MTRLKFRQNSVIFPKTGKLSRIFVKIDMTRIGIFGIFYDFFKSSIFQIVKILTWVTVWYFLHKFFLCQILAVWNSFDGARAEISFEKRLFSKGTLNCHCLKIQYLLSVRYSIIMANSKDVRPTIQQKLTQNYSTPKSNWFLT